ncbi:uncharacterized protein G2W53_039941 [Senna tora]|uniref:Uncharacterized protein n=1 Tax=Senna tora TaxID=362788 RepID=A0A834SRX3_9FABA|nr:uncharacterized protein G2W53_039941 [Senna tora]
MDNPSKGQHILKGRAGAIKWQPITATTANSREASSQGGLGETPENGHPTQRTPHEWKTLRRDNIYRRDGPLPSNGSLSPRPRPQVARLAPQYPSSRKGWRIGGVAGEWSSDKANTSRMDNMSRRQQTPKGRAVAIKWQPITATTANSREASPSIPIIPIGGVAGEWSSDKANTSRMDNISRGQQTLKGQAVAIKWQPITATTANSREASPSIPIIP